MEQNINKSKKTIMILVIVTIVLASSLGVTFAYFSATATNTNTVKSNAGQSSLNINIERVYPISTYADYEMIPLLDAALDKAIKGTGGISNCVDELGNLSCQVYKITLTNTGTTTLVINGTITLSKSNSSSNFDALKWRELTDATNVNSGKPINGMTSSTLISNVSIDASDANIYYIAVWISENNNSQETTNYGLYYGKLDIVDSKGYGVTGYFGSEYTNAMGVN